MNAEKNYLQIVQDVLDNGEWQETRTQYRAKAIPFVSIKGRIGLDENGLFTNFPALTTKKLAFKTMAVELEGFIKGITDKKWYQERGCKIWDQWANPQKVEDSKLFSDMYPDEFFDDDGTVNMKKVQAGCTDLGPIYGYQWRSFNRGYEGLGPDGFDQLKSIVNTLKTNPDDRRMVCSAWNPNQMNMMALPPCHVLWNVVCINGVINLGWYQRSCDLMLGVPFNLASYALLMCLLCKETGLKPGAIHGTLANCHIYENQIDGAKEQLNRELFELPSLQINGFTSIYEWEADQSLLVNYNNAGKLSFGNVAV